MYMLSLERSEVLDFLAAIAASDKFSSGSSSVSPKLLANSSKESVDDVATKGVSGLIGAAGSSVTFCLASLVGVGGC